MLKLSHLTLVTIVTLAPSAAFAQRKPDLAGDFLGSLGPLHLKLHLASTPGGSLTGSLDSINQGAIGLECSNFDYDGTAKPDSLFEIGSITKTFTGLILAQMVEQGKVQYAFLAKQGLGKPPNPSFLYSNVGFGLLGLALANRAGISYPELLQQEITGPLDLKDTVIGLSPDQRSRFLPGHDAEHREAHAWDLDAIVGAGGIRSTAGDMLTFLGVQLHPEKLSSQNTGGATLPAAVVQSHQPRADVRPGVRIALAWMFKTGNQTYWHDGATGGYSSYALFNLKGDYAAIVLVNTLDNTGFADLLGEHIAARLEGKAAISLQN
ncbi:MAG TPA: serine hydrolase domain-containing protein [Chthoniobacterales bacterium]|nr:serine hydrolase domain-containing protein [Chthoniobacterales bacterium]